MFGWNSDENSPKQNIHMNSTTQDFPLHLYTLSTSVSICGLIDCFDNYFTYQHKKIEIILRNYPSCVLMLLHLLLLLTFPTALEEKKHAHTHIQLHIHVKVPSGSTFVLTFLLALRRSALRLAFSSSLKSSSPFIAPWAHKQITDHRTLYLHPAVAQHCPVILTPFVYLGQSGIIARVGGGGAAVHLLLLRLDRGACREASVTLALESV